MAKDTWLNNDSGDDRQRGLRIRRRIGVMCGRSGRQPGGNLRRPNRPAGDRIRIPRGREVANALWLRWLLSVASIGQSTAALKKHSRFLSPWQIDIVFIASAFLERLWIAQW